MEEQRGEQRGEFTSRGDLDSRVDIDLSGMSINTLHSGNPQYHYNNQAIEPPLQPMRFKSVPNKFYTHVENLGQLPVIDQKKCVVFQRLDIRNFVKTGTVSMERLKDLRFQEYLS